MARTRKKKTENRVVRIRTTIAVPEDLHAGGLLRARELRRASFSNYIENLIANDLKEAQAA